MSFPLSSLIQVTSPSCSARRSRRRRRPPRVQSCTSASLSRVHDPPVLPERYCTQTPFLRLKAAVSVLRGSGWGLPWLTRHLSHCAVTCIAWSCTNICEMTVSAVPEPSERHTDIWASSPASDCPSDHDSTSMSQFGLLWCRLIQIQVLLPSSVSESKHKP